MCMYIYSDVCMYWSFWRPSDLGVTFQTNFFWWVSCEVLHSFSRTFVSSEMLENQICDPASAEICWRPSDLRDSFYTNLFVGLLTRACIVWAAYVFLGKSWKIKSVFQRRLEFMQAVRFGRYVLNGLAWCTSCAGLHFLVAYSFSGKSVKTESVIQRRLHFLKAVRCGR